MRGDPHTGDMNRTSNIPTPSAGTSFPVLNETADLVFDAKGASHLVLRPGTLPLRNIT